MIKISRIYISILLAAAMMFSVLPMSGFAVYAEEEQEQVDISHCLDLQAAIDGENAPMRVVSTPQKAVNSEGAMLEIGTDFTYEIDGITYNCIVVSSTKNEAAVVWKEMQNPQSDLLESKQSMILSCEEKGGRLIKYAEYQVLSDYQIISLNNNYNTFGCQEYAACYCTAGYWEGDKTYTWTDWSYFIAFDLRCNSIEATENFNSEKYYDGTPFEVDTNSFTWKGTATPTIKFYSDMNGTEISAPSAVGTYYIKLSIADPVVEDGIRYEAAESDYIEITILPIITEQPEGAELYYGYVVGNILSVTAATDGVTYQWYENNSAIDGATQATYTVSTEKTVGTYQYYCKVSLGDYTEQSQTALVIILPCTHNNGVALTHYEKVEADCTQMGVLEYWGCSVCGKKFSDKDGQTEITETEIPISAHTFTHYEGKDPKCTEDGNSEYWTCSVCEKIFSDENGTTEIVKIPTIPALGHREAEIPAVPATCTDTGLTVEVRCSVCDTILTAPQLIPAKGHSLDDGVETTPASCTEKGVKTFRCANCDYTETAEIAALGHNYMNGKCSVCQEVDPNHICTGGTATCVQRAVCEICGKAYSNFAEHTYVDGFCTVCNDPQPDHTHTGGAATCTKQAECTICGKEYGNFGEHILNSGEVTTPATCIEKGVKTFSCTNCDYIRTEEIAATGHSLDDGVEITPANCTENGVKTFSCANCDYIRTEEIAALGHSYVNGKCSVCQAIDENHVCTGGTATCIQKAICTICGSKYGDFAEHNYVDGECTLCHSADPNYTPIVTEPTVTEPTVTEPTMTEPTVTEPTVTYPNITSGTSPSYQTTRDNQSTAPVQKMIDMVNSAADGDTVEITLNGTTKVDKTVFEAIQDRDITVVFKLSGGAYWTINSQDITKAKTVDLGVRLNKNAVPASKIKELAGDNKTVQFTLKHSGDFGFTGILNVPFGKAYNGKFANLYYYSKKEFEFVSVSEISGGNGAFVFTHASDYVAVIDDYSYIEDVSSGAGATDFGSPIDAASPVTNGVCIPQANLPRGFKFSNKKRRYRILKKRRLDDLVFVF